MPDLREGTYRCPVCGHRDTTGVEEGRESRVIRCSHCETLLEITLRGTDELRFRVQVSEEGAAP